MSQCFIVISFEKDKIKREPFSYFPSFQLAYTLGLDIYYYTRIPLEIASKLDILKWR